MKIAPSTPKGSSLIKSMAVALLSLAAALGSSQAETLLDERFADGERLQQNLPSSAHWYLDATSGAFSSEVSNGSWNILPPSPPSQINAIAYLSGAVPVTLQPGQSLVVSFVVRPSNPAAVLRFGAFNSGGSRLTNDTSGSTAMLSKYTGYAGSVSLAGGTLDLSKRTKPAKGLFAEAAYQKLGSSSAAVASAESYPVTLTLERTADDKLSIVSEIAGAEFTATDAKGLFAFDALAIALDGQQGMTGIESVSVAINDEEVVDPEAKAPVSLQTETAAFAALAGGSTWYLQYSQTNNAQNWHTLTDWFSGTAGGGTNPASIAATDTFNLNKFKVNSPQITSGTTTFAGGELAISTSGTLSLIGSNTTTTVVPTVVSTGGVIRNALGTLQYLVINNLSHTAGTLNFNSGAANRTLSTSIGTLTGQSLISFSGGGGHLLSITNGYNFTGTLQAFSGTMNFQNNLVTSGQILIADVAKINLSKAVACASLTLTGTTIVPATGDKPGSYTYPPGTYSYATLNAAYPNIFTSGSAGGSITVRGGTMYYLKANQALGHHWGSAYANEWNTQPNGTGSNATAVNPVDDYSTNGKLLRTPAVTDTFAGRTLYLQGGFIAMKNPVPEVCTIPTVVATSGTIIQYLNTSGTASLRVNYFTQNTGTTVLYATSNQTVDLSIDYLSGNGTFRCPTAGESRFTVVDASQFTGTYTQASGTLRLAPITSGPVYAVGSPFAMKGSLVVNAGAKVVLDRDTYVGGLVVSGTTKASGTYTAASLGASFSGSAKLVVNTPDLSGPPQLFGVNIAAGTFAAGGALLPTNAATWDYYQAKGLTLIRVPFSWEHVQTTVSGTLTAAVMTKMNTILSLANARGMKVIFDMHNYGAYKVSGTSQPIGSTFVPYSAYQDVWNKLSAYFAASPNKAALYGYDIMNEPQKLGNDWPNAAKYAIAGIRANDMTTYIVAEGKVWAGAQNWPSQNGDLGFIDPACRLIYSAHSYWGKNHNDGYLSYDDEKGYPNMAVDQLRLFVDWIKKRKFNGFIGEYGVPTNVATPDLRWHTVLENALIYMRANGVSGTYWSGGYGWGTYSLLCDTGTPPVDAPPMSVLQNYHQ